MNANKVIEVQNLVDEELGNYPHYEGYELKVDEIYEGYCTFTLEFPKEIEVSDMRLKVDSDNISVELGEFWREIEGEEHTIKYFWIALLS